MTRVLISVPLLLLFLVVRVTLLLNLNQAPPPLKKKEPVMLWPPAALIPVMFLTQPTVPKKFYRENPEIIQGFVNAMQKGMDYVNSHTAEEIAKIIKPQFKENDLDTITTIVKRYKDQDTWKDNLVFEKTVLNFSRIFWTVQVN